MLRVRVPRLATVSGGPGGVIAGTGAATGISSASASGASIRAASGSVPAVAFAGATGASIRAATGVSAGAASVFSSESPPIQQVLLVDNDNKIVTFGFLLLR